MLRRLALAAVLFLPMAAIAEERVFQIEGGHVSVPVGVTAKVKTVTVGEDATVVRMLVTLNTSQTGSVELAVTQNPTLQWGEGQMLHMRQIKENPSLTLNNGQTLLGDLVFAGVIPEGVETVNLVFNPDRDGVDISGPGLTILLVLK